MRANDVVDVPDLAVVYMTTETDKLRVEQEPPQLPFTVANDPEAKKNILDVFRRGAHQYDMYNDIVQLSFLYQDNFVHTLYCADPDVRTDEPIAGDQRIITTTDTEEQLIRTVVAFIKQIHQETADGVVVTPVVFAGWKMNTLIWPMLVNKALAYGVRLPKSLVSSPLRKFPVIDNLLDVSNVYSQGTSMAMRRLPALADALKYWGYRDGDEKPRHPAPENIVETVCSDPVSAAKDVEVYLRDMYSILCRYYGQGDGYGIE